MKILFVLFISIFSQLSFSNSLTDFHDKGCELTGSYSKWFIVSKLGNEQYDVSISMGRYKPMKKGIINLKTIQFSKKGEIGYFIFLKKVSVKKMKLKDGFDVSVTTYNESLECKEHYLRKVSFIQGSYPKSPVLDQKIWNEDQERLKKKREEWKKKKASKDKKQSIEIKKKTAIENKTNKKRESLYD